MDAYPKLAPGYGFHLEGDGFWDVQEIPPNVLAESKYSGEFEIEGFPAVVFEMPDGDQWAQKAPGTPAPKGDQGAETVLKEASSRFSSDVLDMLKEFDVDDEVGLWHWLNKNGIDHDEAEKETINNVFKAFEKAFPGEKLNVREKDLNSPQSLKHEIQHIVSEPNFDLEAAHGTRSKAEAAADELSMVLFEAGDKDKKAWARDEEVDFSSIYHDVQSIWSDGMTVGDYLDALDAQPFVSKKKEKYFKKAVSYLRHHNKPTLGEKMEEPDSFKAAIRVVDKLDEYMRKDNEMAPDPSREVKYKMFQRLLRKYQRDILDRLKSKSGHSASGFLALVASRVAAVGTLS